MIRYRHGQITRADNSDAADAPLRVVLANEGRMGDGLDLKMSGVDLARFLDNPVLGYGHNYWGRDSMPIGRVEDVEVSGKKLVGTAVFDQEDEFAATVERKIRNRFINAFSIGFDPLDVDKEGVVSNWELFELSVVPIPMDPGALVAAGRTAALALAGLHGAIDLTQPVREDTGRSTEAVDGGAGGNDENPHNVNLARHRVLQLSGVTK